MVSNIQAKIGGKQVIGVLIQQSDDIVRSLLYRPAGGREFERALPGLVRDKYRGAVNVEVIAGLRGPSALMLQQLEAIPPPAGLGESPADAGSDPIRALFDDRPLPEEVDVVVVSVRPELVQPVWRHRRSGYLLAPPAGWEHKWPPRSRQWLRGQCVPTESVDVRRSMLNLRRLVGAVKRRWGAHVIAYNCSRIDPADHVHNYHGREHTLAVRVQKLNLALMELSVLEGISIIDVERLAAELGGRHVPEALVYSAHLYREICREFLRVLEDIGFFEKRPLVMQVGKSGARAPGGLSPDASPVQLGHGEPACSSD